MFGFGGLDMRGTAVDAENERRAGAVRGRVRELAMSGWRCSGDIKNVDWYLGMNIVNGLSV